MATARVRNAAGWTTVAVSAATALLATWILVPAPTYFLLTFGVGAPEVSALLIPTAILAACGAVASRAKRSVVVTTIACSVVTLVLSAFVWARVPPAIARFNAATHLVTSTPANPLRAHPIVIGDLFRAIPRGGPVTVRRNISFASPAGHRLSLDVYQPVQHGRYPIAVQIYGGAWQRGAPSSNADFATWLASGGYVVIAVDYRHAPAFRWPAQIDDVDSALVWVRDHAADYDGDTSRVVLIGRSAGAHLAMLAAYRPSPVRIRGVVSYYGPTDLADAYAHPPHPDPLDIRATERALLGAPPTSMPGQYADASPISYATRALPPTLLIYGGRDHIVEARYGEAMGRALAASGTPMAALEIPWAEHAFDAVFNGPSSQLALYYTERFIAWAVRE
jgi:acetyl esterase/lipase